MKSVLIVEDVAETRRWLGTLVQAAFPEARLTEAATLRAALALLRDSFDLALIDLGLPDGSGLDVLRALRAQQSGALCVVTTVMGDDASIVAALSTGADGYLLKEQPSEVQVRQLTQLSQHAGFIRRRTQERKAKPNAPMTSVCQLNAALP